jgi:hypothetical protein
LVKDFRRLIAFAAPNETCLVVRVRSCASFFRICHPCIALAIGCVVADVVTACMDDRTLQAAPVFGPPLDASNVLEADIPEEGGAGPDGGAGHAGSGAATSTGGSPPTKTGGAPGSGGTGGSVGAGGSVGQGGLQTGTGGTAAGTGGSTGGTTATGGAPVGTGGVVLPSTGGRPALGDCSGPDGVGGDCGPTLVQNATFDADVSHWKSEPTASAKWRASNWKGASGGSVTVTNVNQIDAGGLGMSGVTQCVPVTPFKQYEVSARAYIPSSQQSGSAGISVWIFEGADCKGSLLDATLSSSTFVKDAWTLVNGRVTAPARARSMLVRLIGMKPLRQTSLEVWFDAVGVYGP